MMSSNGLELGGSVSQRRHSAGIAMLLFIAGIAALVCCWAGLPRTFLGLGASSDVQEPETLSHDFGTLSPNTSLQHVFEIANHTGQRITFRELIHSCPCLSGKPLKPFIEPGETAGVLITYKGPSKSDNDAATTVVRFRESWAKAVILRVVARIREPMTLDHDVVRMNLPARDQSIKASFLVQNFGDEDWLGVEVEPADDWLRSEVVRVDQIDKRHGLRQAWRISLTASRSDSRVRGGQLQTIVNVKTSANSEPVVKAIPVELSAQAPVNVAPQELFFGDVAQGKPATCRVVFTFLDQMPGESPIATIEKDLDADLQFEWKTKSEDVRELVATLVVKNQEPALVTGKVSIHFRVESLGHVVLPVQARLQ